MRKTLNLGAISAGLYISFQVIANVLSTKIAVLPLVGLAIDGGTLIYPLTFTLRDFVHKSLGKLVARQVVVTAALVSLLAAGLFVLIGKMTPDASWQFQSAYESILMPVWRITMASIIAQVISELIDTEIFSILYKKFSDSYAVFGSNSLSLVVDSLIFCFIAFAGSLPLPVLIQIVVTNILIKMIMSLVSVPFIKIVPRTANFEEI